MMKSKPTIVTRHFRIREVTGKRVRRTITIYYEYDRRQKVLKYGASIFRMDRKGERYNKQGHLETAQRRFAKKPVEIKNFEDDGSIRDFHQQIRKMLYRYGVRCD